MLIFEAKREIDERIKLKSEYEKFSDVQPYFEALEMASKALEAQNRLADMLNTFDAEDEEKHKDDTYSRRLTIELLKVASMDYVNEDEMEDDE